MYIKSVTFSIAKTTPLFPITKNAGDQYANVRPMASCTIEFDAKEVDAEDDVEQKTKYAYHIAEQHCIEQLTEFHTSLVEMLKP